MLKKKGGAVLNVIKLILRLEKKHVILTFSCKRKGRGLLCCVDRLLGEAWSTVADDKHIPS